MSKLRKIDINRNNKELFLLNFNGICFYSN